MRIPLIAVLCCSSFVATISVQAQKGDHRLSASAFVQARLRTVQIDLASGDRTTGTDMGKGEVVTIWFPALHVGTRVQLNGLPGKVVRMGVQTPTDKNANLLVLLKWDNPTVGSSNAPPKASVIRIGLEGIGINRGYGTPSGIFMARITSTEHNLVTLSDTTGGGFHHGIGFYDDEGSMIGIILGEAIKPGSVPQRPSQMPVPMFLFPTQKVLAFLGRISTI